MFLYRSTLSLEWVASIHLKSKPAVLFVFVVSQNNGVVLEVWTIINTDIPSWFTFCSACTNFERNLIVQMLLQRLFGKIIILQVSILMERELHIRAIIIIKQRIHDAYMELQSLFLRINNRIGIIFSVMNRTNFYLIVSIINQNLKSWIEIKHH